MLVQIPQYINTKKAEFEWLVAHKNEIISEKKAELKPSLLCSFDFASFRNNDIAKQFTTNELPEDTETVIHRLIVGNTVHLEDHHNDVHGWNAFNKTLADKNSSAKIMLPYKNQHRQGIENNIIDKIYPFMREISWKDLGENYEGITNALMAIIALEKDNKSVPEYIFSKHKRYAIQQHSIGMRYKNIILAINDADFKDEFATWNEFFNKIVNKEDTLKKGHFWYVSELELLEISPVEAGSNWVTPTAINEKSINIETLMNKIKEYEPNFSLETINSRKPLENNDNKKDKNKFNYY